MWTESDSSRFIKEDFPSFFPIYSSFGEQAVRARVAGYLILKRFGGVRVDPGCECLRPIDGLLDGQRLVIGLEPPEHAARQRAVERGLSRIPCPAFIASVPGHPFWDHVLGRIAEARHCPDADDVAGAFLLGRALAGYDGSPPVTVVPSDRLYPATEDDCRSGRIFDLAFWEQATRHAYALHRWDGAEPGTGDEFLHGLPKHAPVHIGEGPASAGPAGVPEGTLPRISCLMVAGGGIGEAGFAIDGFLRQTYPNRELVIVDDRPGDGLERLVRGLGRADVRLVRVADRELPPGRLRNLLLDHATGHYICRWDVDDLHDPKRLEVQYRVLKQTGAQACLLGRRMIWWPRQERLAVSALRDWEGSLLCETAAMPRHPLPCHDGDAPVVGRLRRTGRVVRLDLPRLCTHIGHGDDRSDTGHADAHWSAASARFTGERCRAVLGEMGKRLPVEACLRRFGTPAPDPDTAVSGRRADRTGAASVERGANRLDASIVICTFRRLALLEACLDSLLDQVNPYGGAEVVVVDNCAAASAGPVARRAAPALAQRGVPLRYVVEENNGVAFARNRGLDEARHGIVCFIDDDERAYPDWLANLLRPFAEHGTGVDIVAGEVEPDFGGMAQPEWLQGEFLHYYSCKLGWDTKPRFLKENEWFGEGNCAFRKALLADHRFDTALGRKANTLLSSEGIVFWKLRKEGASVVFSPDAKVHHFIHPERLNKQWMLKRMLYQGMSDYVAYRSMGLVRKVNDYNISPSFLLEVDAENLEGKGLSGLCTAYYDLGYSLARNMF